MELSIQQQTIVAAQEPRIVVIASAASGKTATLVARLQYLLAHGTDPQLIVAITFTNAAAGEILDRLNRPKGLFVGTIHSYANQLLRSHGIDTSDIIEDEQFDKLFAKVRDNPYVTRRVKHLLLDEAQDSTDEQYDFLLNYVSPENWFFVGDWRQSIYGWKGANPRQLLDLAQRADVTTYELNENYRNDKKILSFAKGIIRLAGTDYLDNSVPMSQVDGQLIETEFEPVLLARYIAMREEYGSWFVLTRTNDQIDYFGRYLTAENVPFDTFKRAQLSNAQLAAKMKENTVKLLTIHTSKGLEADKVAVIGARFYNLEEKCVSYVAATRAKHLLIWARMPNAPRRRERTVNWETY